MCIGEGEGEYFRICVFALGCPVCCDAVVIEDRPHAVRRLYQFMIQLCNLRFYNSCSQSEESSNSHAQLCHYRVPLDGKGQIHFLTIRKYENI